MTQEKGLFQQAQDENLKYDAKSYLAEMIALASSL
jgi:hypothetical protein